MSFLFWAKGAAQVGVIQHHESIQVSSFPHRLIELAFFFFLTTWETSLLGPRPQALEEHGHQMLGLSSSISGLVLLKSASISGHDPGHNA